MKEIDEIPTPALLIDLDKMESNIKKMAGMFEEFNRQGYRVKLRPHVKTHKTPILAHKQIDAGQCSGITCSKLGEAQVMADAGIKNILIANQVVQKEKIGVLANLGRHTEIMVAVDNPENLTDISNAAAAAKSKIGVLVEIDVGLHRCGVRTVKDALRLAKHASNLDGIEFKGLQGYEGHLVNIRDKRERKRKVHHDMQILLDIRHQIEKSGIPVDIVSSGGTGTYDITGRINGIDEVQAGTYIFMDTNYNKILNEFVNALTILVTVVSHPEKDLYIVDCGLKTLSNDEGAVPEPAGYTVKSIKLHEEHTLLWLDCHGSTLKVGSKLEIIVGHACTTVNLHDRYYGIRDRKVETIWDISARGRSW